MLRENTSEGRYCRYSRWLYIRSEKKALNLLKLPLLVLDLVVMTLVIIFMVVWETIKDAIRR